MSIRYGRQLMPGPTDNAAAARTPGQPLLLIPEAARRSFVPWVETLPGLRAGENDLTRLAPGRPIATGNPIGVHGRLTDRTGRPVKGVLLEIWNANAQGRYAHVDDHSDVPLDPYFRGFGRTLTDSEGRYGFRTILPGAYLARPDIGRWRPRHIHFSISGGSARLITQLYFAGDPHNERDPGFILLGEAQPRHIAVEETPDQFRFDIVMDGPNVSWFE